MKPQNRKERVAFLINKLGKDVILKTVAFMNDKEMKDFFETMYPLYKDRNDYITPDYKQPECLVCGSVTITHWECACGHAIIDELDPTLQDLKDSGEYQRIQKLIIHSGGSYECVSENK